MTIAQLIQKLKRFDPDMPVVIKPSMGHNLPDDFYELKFSDLVELKTKPVYKDPFWENQVYDASETIKDRSAKVLSLSGGTHFQRGDEE